MKIKFSLKPEELVSIVKSVAGYGRKELKVRKTERELDAKKANDKANYEALKVENERLKKEFEEIWSYIRNNKSK